jgi:type II protein arginine methyltransferase
MLVLEIGTGSGILAMLAARAGAQVVSCENDPVLAALASETIRLNGLDRRVHIIRKSSQNLRMPADLPGLADLLMLDLFANRLFDFRPFEIIRSTRRLLRPDAISVPRQVSLEAALADFGRWFRMVPGHVSGFDLSTLGDLSGGSTSLDPREPDLSLRSATEPMVRAGLPADLPAETGSSEKIMISSGGPVNGLAVWVRMDLAHGHVLETKPGSAPHGFYARPVFYAFRKTLNTVAGQPCRVRLRWEGNAVSVSHVEQ